MGVFWLWRDLLGNLFLVYAAHADALSQSDLGNFPFVANIAVLLTVSMVRFILSAIAVVSLCLGTISFKVIARCFNSNANSLFRNSPPQSAWICETWLVVAFSRAFMISMSASEVSSLVRNGYVVSYRL